MHTLHDFIITPKEGTYNNTKEVSGVDVVVNSDISNHLYISREAIVKEVPSAIDTPIKKGDEVIVHHNIFRSWYDVRGEERKSSGFITDGVYKCGIDQIFMYKKDGKEWKGLEGFCFVSPIENQDDWSIEDEEPLVGILEVSNDSLESMGLKVGDKIGFTPSSEYEFNIDDKKMYKMSVRDICLLY